MTHRRLYLDCDGVLADFDRHFLETFGHPSRDYEQKHGPNVFWKNLREHPDRFYRHLPLMPNARALYEAVRVHRPLILTGTPMGGWAEIQKIEWAHEHFSGVPIIPCKSRDKRDFCQPGDLLIDDWPKYRELWEGAGGEFILHRDEDLHATIAGVMNWESRG